MLPRPGSEPMTSQSWDRSPNQWATCSLCTVWATVYDPPPPVDHALASTAPIISNDHMWYLWLPLFTTPYNLLPICAWDMTKTWKYVSYSPTRRGATINFTASEIEVNTNWYSIGYSEFAIKGVRFWAMSLRRQQCLVHKSWLSGISRLWTWTLDSETVDFGL